MGRLAVLTLAALGIFLLLLARLIFLQIFSGAYYRELSNNNRVREIPLPAPRGVITDRFGQPLTVNLPALRLSECENSECHGRIVSKNQAIALEAAGLKSNQTLAVDAARSYPAKEAAAHLVGYVSGEAVGQDGAEEAGDFPLRGRPGKELVETDARGRKIRTLSVVPPQSGENIRLTVDARLQRIIYEQMKGKIGAVVASDPLTGEILALISVPSFDPNLFTDLSLDGGERTRGIEKLFADSHKPLFNRAISGVYPPGSTFKIVTAAAGLETGAINKNTLVEDTGIITIGPYKFPNWRYLKSGAVEGVLDVVGAIRRSNDIFFYKAGEWAGIERLTDWAGRFGLGKKLGLDLPGEAAGLVPDKAWRDKTGREWFLGDTYHLAIGQGDLLVTPLQVNAWTSVIANGGRLCRPTIVQSSKFKVQSNCEDLGLKKETVDLIRGGMTAACSEGGTGWPFFGFAVRSSRYTVACKTGTAEYGPSTGSGQATHAWLTLFISEPPMALTVLVEGGGEGSDVAGPIARKILEQYLVP